MARPFSTLRSAMTEADVDESVLARLLGIRRETVSRKMSGRAQWTLSEMYAALDLLGRPAKDLHLFFPPGGQNEEGCSRGKAAVAGRRVARDNQRAQSAGIKRRASHGSVYQG